MLVDPAGSSDFVVEPFLQGDGTAADHGFEVTGAVVLRLDPGDAQVFVVLTLSRHDRGDVEQLVVELPVVVGVQVRLWVWFLAYES